MRRSWTADASTERKCRRRLNNRPIQAAGQALAELKLLQETQEDGGGCKPRLT
jgi:hypothetical protein